MDHTAAPLAVRMRPRSLDELVGQQHLLAPGSPLRRLVEGDQPMSLLLWGPPGTGKTTIAAVVSHQTNRKFVELSAVTAGVKDVRQVIDGARRDLARADGSVETVLFIDEVHRFTKAQQDALLPGVENRWVTLVAATTENPFFSVISPLLSRSLLLTLESLTDDDIALLLDRALVDERGLAGEFTLADDARDHLLRMAGGDARRALTYLEAAAGGARAKHPTRATGTPASTEAKSAASGAPDTLASGGIGPSASGAGDSASSAGAGSAASGTSTSGESGAAAAGVSGASAFGTSGSGEVGSGGAASSGGGVADGGGVAVIDLETLETAVDRAAVRYDRAGDQHYDVASALIKSIRGSDVDAAMHYLARMIVAGEDPRFIARRLVISASEDIGMGDPAALGVAVAAAEAVQLIGMPEARINLAQAVVALALAPKSNAVITAVDAAISDVKAGKIGPVPAHLRDAHYSGAKKIGHGASYQYSHNDPRGVVSQQYAPDVIDGTDYYTPTRRGGEAAYADRVEAIRKILRDRK
ncbi:replication-associated recombination protein A [Kribbella sandramycini]|uniref:Putative ATPase n=2 Tax=Kribbella sandramycini TaxID=60450 RepID=A0A7Y4P3R6_9ACTN|nr:replication-associated recombination protein A [Kribbella sandramycini]MBB6570151.1 putative ATPase [Kribbella sandramycini]NOL45348.1 replication-associated recombination protein A [Kribbella sandramycini]